MTAIDRPALIEVLRDELAGWPIGSGYYGTQVGTGEAREMAEAVLPVIAAGLLAPLRELHFAKSYTCIHLRPPGELGPCCRRSICADCNQMHPCPTVRLLDQIEADVAGGE